LNFAWVEATTRWSRTSWLTRQPVVRDCGGNQGSQHQQAAAEAAAEAGAKVCFDPATERLADVGFELPGLAYHPPAPYDVDQLATQPGQRTALVAGVLAAHPKFVNTVTPPHFFVRDERSANLNVSLAEETLHEHGADVRATLIRRAAAPPSPRAAGRPRPGPSIPSLLLSVGTAARRGDRLGQAA
jgi:hypothetical protein